MSSPKHIMTKAVTKSIRKTSGFHMCGACGKGFFMPLELSKHACSSPAEKPAASPASRPLLPQISNSDIVDAGCKDIHAQEKRPSEVQGHSMQDSAHASENHPNQGEGDANIIPTMLVSHAKSQTHFYECSQESIQTPKHASKSNRCITCEQCGLDFLTSSGLKKHDCYPPRAKHVPRGDRFTSSRNSLIRPKPAEQSDRGTQQDMAISKCADSTGVFPVCIVCGKGFFTSLELKEHICVHPEHPPNNDGDNQKQLPKPQTSSQKVDSQVVCGKGFGQVSVMKKCMPSISAIKPIPYGIGKKPPCRLPPPKRQQSGDQIQEVNQPAGKKPLDKVKETAPGEKSHSCSQNENFLKDPLLKVESARDPGGKLYKCSVCDKSFSHKTSREQHMYIHTKEWPSVCSECGMGCVSLSALKAHMYIHTGEKPHVCQQCGKGFRKASHLKDHTFTHTDEKPHKCEKCGQGFSQVAHLKSHIKTHTKEKLIPVKKRHVSRESSPRKRQDKKRLKPDQKMLTNQIVDKCFPRDGDENITLSLEPEQIVEQMTESKENNCSLSSNKHNCIPTSGELILDSVDIEEETDLTQTLNLMCDKGDSLPTSDMVDILCTEGQVPCQLKCAVCATFFTSVDDIGNHVCNIASTGPIVKVLRSEKVPSTDDPLINISGIEPSKTNDKDSEIYELVGPDQLQTSCTDKGNSLNSSCDPNFEESTTVELEQCNSNTLQDSPNKETPSFVSQEPYQRPCSKSYANRKVIPCPHCRKQFPSEADLKRHTYIHTGEKPHVCLTCGKTFRQLGTLKSHSYIHTGDWPHVCEDCGKGFSTETALKVHGRTHTGSKPHLCGVCGKGFSRVSNLKGHLIIHTGHKPHKCTICGRGFTQVPHLQKHLQSHARKLKSKKKGSTNNFIHGQEEVVEESCHPNQPSTDSADKENSLNSSCDPNIEHSAVMELKQCDNIHLKDAPNKETLSFISQEPYERPCSKSYASRKLIPCPHCRKQFASEGDLKRHTYIHTGEKPHVCLTCGKKFRQLGTLKSHSYIHNGDWPHVCEDCGKGFSTETALKVHGRMHTGSKPYLCGVCGKGFSRMSHLKGHSFTHTGHKPQSCNICGRGFTHVPHLQKHLQSHAQKMKSKKKPQMYNKSRTINIVQSQEEAVEHSCQGCIQGFVHVEELIGHLSSHK